jgi:hypothetical protein
MAMKDTLRRASLTEAVMPHHSQPVLREVPQAAPPRSNEPEAVRSRSRADARKEAGLTTLSGWVPEVAKRQFDHLAIDSGNTNQGLLLEALNLLFRHYGKPLVARPEA